MLTATTPTPAFGLYTSAGCTPSTRVAAGTQFTLGSPVFEEGVPLFRRSLWMPVPPRLAQASLLSLGNSDAKVRFSPLRWPVTIASGAWFSAVKSLGSQRVRLTMTLPAPILQFRRSATAGQYTFGLYRADGDAVADEAAQQGRTAEDLNPPWMGADTVLELGVAIGGLQLEQVAQQGQVMVLLPMQAVSAVSAVSASAPASARPARAVVSGSTGGESSASGIGLTQQAVVSTIVSQVIIDGRPTSPRLRLLAEHADGSSSLLWQALEAGPQATVSLPGEPIGDAWAPALGQLAALLADPDRVPQRLRLDIESDLPCQATLDPLSLAMEADIEVLAAPVRFDFDGTRSALQSLPLTLPDLGTAQSLTLTGRVVADAAAGADAGGLAIDGRRGVLAAPERVLRQQFDLNQPMRLGGVTLAWQPLSDRMRGQWRLLSDDGRPLATEELDLATPQGGWLALRRAPLSLQTQAVWLELTLTEGSGLWLFADTDVDAPPGTLDEGPLPAPLWWAPLPGGSDVNAATRPLSLAVGPHAVVGPLPAGVWTAQITGPALSALAVQPVSVAGGVAGSLSVESAQARMRLA